MPLILVIDDEEPIRRLLKRVLEKGGYEVVTAADGDEGMRRYRERPADLVITDLIMPGKEGIETIMELRKGDPGVKIIAMSGGGRLDPEGLLQAAGSLGAARTLSKPIERETLLGAVGDLLGP